MVRVREGRVRGHMMCLPHLLPDLHFHSSIKQDVGVRVETATRSVG